MTEKDYARWPQLAEQSTKEQDHDHELTGFTEIINAILDKKYESKPNPLSDSAA